MDFEDPIIRRVGQAALVVIMITFVSIGFLTSWVVVDWDGSGNRSQWLVECIRLLPDLAGKKTGEVKTVSAVFLSSLPLLFAAVCFVTVDGRRRLNSYGGLVLCGLLLAIILAMYGYLGIDFEWKDGHELGEDGLARAQAWAQAVMTTCMFYVAGLLGLKAQT